MSLNVVTVIGRLGGNPEIIMFNSGAQRIRFSIAVNRDYKDEDGNRPTDWIPVIGWGKGCANYVTATHLAKGDEICISGRLENTHWQDENGKNCTGFCINVDRMYLTNKKRSKDGASAENAQSKNDVAYENPAYSAEEDLPF